jgi:hypothetical protein
MLNRTLGIVNKNPKTLFVIDGLGALLSTFLLALVLAQFEHIFGMPRKSLYLLAIFPCLYAVFDLNCIVKEILSVPPFLKAIAILNFSYCLISFGFAIYHYQELTVLGWLYFIGEILVVASLAAIEYKTAKMLSV